MPVSIPEVRAVIVDDSLLNISILSEDPEKDTEFRFHTTGFRKRVILQQEPSGLYAWRWQIPAESSETGKQKLLFLKGDNLFFSLEHCIIHRSYENIPEPNRFEAEIRIFEIMDHFNPPPEGSVLFTGSSTIRKWHSIDNDFQGIQVIKRGFGGSTMKDLNQYAARIVIPYKPSRVFVYEGDNDIARGAGPEDFINDCTDFIHLCRQYMPDTDIYFLSIKPSPARNRNWDSMYKANLMLSDLAERYDKVHYIDISTEMLTSDGMPREHLYDNDRLHLNDAGYEILVNAIIPYLNE
jgi:lysophospholipase L1-like esterase